MEQVQGVAGVGLLLPHYARSDLAGVTDPQLVSELRQHPLEPLRVAGGSMPTTTGFGKLA